MECSVQIMEERLTGVPAHKIEDCIFITVRDAYKLCLKLLWIEEKFNIVSGNFYEWEEEIRSSYNFLITQQSDQPNCAKIMNEHGNKQIIVFNRRLSNFLSSVRMYQDQVLHDLSTIDSKLKIEFKEETSRQYDKTFSYQLMELMGTHMQHQGLIIESITAIIPFNRKVQELLYFVETRWDSIKRMEKFEKKIKCKEAVSDQNEWLNLIESFRDYYSQVAELHNYFRSITNKRLSDAITRIKQELKKIYRDIPVKKVAFYGTNTSSEMQDYLLQMTYIDQLLIYRRNDVALDKSKYYIDKKTYLNADGIRVSNSIRCKFIYNS